MGNLRGQESSVIDFIFGFNTREPSSEKVGWF